MVNWTSGELITATKLNLISTETYEIIRQMHPNLSVLTAIDDTSLSGIVKDGTNYVLSEETFVHDDHNDNSVDNTLWDTTITTGGGTNPGSGAVTEENAAYMKLDAWNREGSEGSATVISVAEKFVWEVSARAYSTSSAGGRAGYLMVIGDVEHKYAMPYSTDTYRTYKVYKKCGNITIEEDGVEVLSGADTANAFKIGYQAHGGSCFECGDVHVDVYVDYDEVLKSDCGDVLTDSLAANAAILSFFSHLKGKFSNSGSTHTTPVGVEIFDNALVVVEDCEDVWSEIVDGDVVSEIDSDDFKTGNASIKLTVSDAVAAGDILATEAVTSIDISQAEAIVMWIKSSVTTSPGDLQILLDDTAQCASPLKSLDIPALTAGVWTQVNLDIDDASGLTAIISIGLKYVTDLGVCTIWVDDIEAPYLHPLNATTELKIDPVDPRIELYRIDNSVVAKSDAQTDWALDDNSTNGVFSAKTTSTHETILAEEIGCASVVVVEKSVNGAFTDTKLLAEDDDYTVDYSTRTATKIILATSTAADIVNAQSKLRITWIVDVENIDGMANTSLKMKIYLNRTDTTEASPEIQSIDLGTGKYAEMKYMCG